MPRPRIWPMSVSQRDRGGQSRLVANDSGRVALAREVFGQGHVARAVAVHGAVAETDLDFAGQGDHELAARRVVPVDEVAGLRRAKDDALRRLQGAELRMGGQIQLLDVRLAVFAGV